MQWNGKKKELVAHCHRIVDLSTIIFFLSIFIDDVCAVVLLLLYDSFDVMSSCNSMKCSIDLKLNILHCEWAIGKSTSAIIFCACFRLKIPSSVITTDWLTLFELSIDNAIKYLCYTLGTLASVNSHSPSRSCSRFHQSLNGKYMLWNVLSFSGGNFSLYCRLLFDSMQIA